MKWSYGVTAHPSRLDDILPRTISSLKNGGFDDPLIFLDGDGTSHVIPPASLQKHRVVFRQKRIGAFANFTLALWELYLRDPTADRYAIFQDDIICCRNLRQYLEKCHDPDRGYWNLYTWPSNVKAKKGWSLSDQWGRGALGLVFTNEATTRLLAAPYLVNHPKHAHLGRRGIDKAVLESFKAIGWREMVHNPSLVQHTGRISSIGHRMPVVESPVFCGEDFDALELV